MKEEAALTVVDPYVEAITAATISDDHLAALEKLNTYAVPL